MAMEHLVEDNPASPNAIPARSSSMLNGLRSPPSKSVLTPLPEDSWISLSTKHKSMPPPIATASYSHSSAGLGDARHLRNGSLDGATSHKHSKKALGTSQTFQPKSPSNDFTQWSAAKEKIILGPYDYLDANPGKDIRVALISAFNAVLQVPAGSLAAITKIVGMLHTSSLLIDDVEDNSFLRRGSPVAHSIFGTAQTINSANYVYFLALQELHKLSNWQDALEIYTTEILNLHRGQGMDLYWRDTLTCPTEDDYLEMVQNKTGGLFRLAIKLLQLESPERGRRDCVPLVNLMGLIFQICDDYLNLSSTAYTKNKGLCEDLTEGKFSFPVIHSIRSEPGNLQLINILKQKTTDEGVKRYAVRYMESTGSFEYTKRVVKELRTKAIALINEMDAGTERTAEIQAILARIDVE